MWWKCKCRIADDDRGKLQEELMKEDMKMKKTSIKATAVTSFYPLYDEENEEEEGEVYAYEEYEYYEDLEQVLNMYWWYKLA